MAAVAPTRISPPGTQNCSVKGWVDLGQVFRTPLFPFGLHMSLSRSILLVGEGNFSFSASLCQVQSDTATSVTATCLQSQEEALRHEGAADNIQIIKNSGLWVFWCPCWAVFCESIAFLVCFIRWSGAVRGGLQKAWTVRFSPGPCVWPCGV